MNKRPDQRLRVNNQIKAAEVEVIDATGAKLGAMATHEALKLANEQGLDLIEINPQTKPPIAKLLDYGKFMYQREKRGHSGKSKPTAQEVKTVRIGFRTEIHDLIVRASQSDKFLKKGFRVKLQLTLRGREREMANLGKEKLIKFLDLISEKYTVDSEIKRYPGGFETLLRSAK